MNPNIDTVAEFAKLEKCDSFITLDGRVTPSQSYLVENSGGYVSLKFKDPVIPLKAIKVTTDVNDIREYVEHNEAIKYYRPKGKRNWIPITKHLPLKKDIYYLGEITNLEWWRNCVNFINPKCSSGYTLGFYGFEKQGYSNINYDYVDDGTLIVSDNDYEHYALDKDGSSLFVYMYWLRLYTFSCYEEAMHFIEDNLTGNIGDIQIRYSGAGDWKLWRQPEEYAKDIQASWFKKNEDYEYDGCWDGENKGVTTRTKPKKNQIIISEFADV